MCAKRASKSTSKSPKAMSADRANLALLPLIRWGMAHMTEFREIPNSMQTVKDAITAKNLDGTWGGVKGVGDLVVPTLKDCPLLPAEWQNTGNIFSALKAASRGTGLKSVEGAIAACDPEALMRAIRATETGETAHTYKAIGDGTLLEMIKNFLALLPELMAAIKMIMDLFNALSGK